MNLQPPRLSISNCVLPTAVDWVVLRKLREWHNVSEQAVKSAITPVCGGPSPFWISTNVARYLFNALTQAHPTAIKTSCAVVKRKETFTGKCTSPLNKHGGAHFFYNKDRAVDVFGLSFVNTSDTTLSSIVDSTTCVSYMIPVDESGDVLWALKHRQCLGADSSFNSTIQAKLPKKFTSRPTALHKRHEVPLFYSPYWLDAAALETRWKGVRMAPRTTPVYIHNGTQCFINAEQTTDASRFHALSCTPQRRHQYVSCSGVQHFSWDFSEKLTRAFSDMRNDTHNENSSSSSSSAASSSSFTLTNDRTDLPALCPTEQHQTMETPSNLWLDVELIETAGWSVRNTAVALEVPAGEITPPVQTAHEGTCTRKNQRHNNVTRIIVNAACLLERDPLLDLIAYMPESILTDGRGHMDAATRHRLAIMAAQMKYSNPTWLCASLVQRKQLRGRRGGDITGVEARVCSKWGSPPVVCVLINVDELHITPEGLTELRNRGRTMTVSSST